MLAAVFVLVIACASVLAGRGYVRKARAMRSFQRVPGVVLTREVVASPPGQRREGLFGEGGGSMPKVTYAYRVDGKDYVGGRIRYASRGLKREVAEKALAAIPDQVDVWFDPASPSDAYLERHAPALGWALLIGGSFTALLALLWMVGQRT